MRVMLDVFSGRPNPTWQVPPSLAQHVRQLMSRQGGPVSAAPTPALGYRGLLVGIGPEDADAPAAFYVGVSPPATMETKEEAVSARRARLPDEEREAVLALLESARPLVARAVIDEAARSVELRGDGVAPRANRSAALRASGAEAPTAAEQPEVEPPCEPILAAYSPWFWNTPSVRLRNNCYNYASNYVSNFVAQPGRRVGRQYDEFSCEAVARAAIADGFRANCDGPARLAALAVWPGHDFHWYRSHGDFWGHKLGIYSARNVDNRGRVIAGALTPATCDRGPYTQFCSYLFVPPGVEVF
jgi:hypothetical protein